MTHQGVTADPSHFINSPCERKKREVCNVTAHPSRQFECARPDLERRAVVCRWQTAFGFLRDLESGSEVFAHRDSVVGRVAPPIGALVRYRTTVDALGRPKAVNVVLVTQPERHAATDDHRRTGRISRWFADRHFGFVETFDGASYFLHGKDLDAPQLVAEGARIIFALAPGRHGDDVAVRARLVRDEDGNR